MNNNFNTNNFNRRNRRRVLKRRNNKNVSNTQIANRQFNNFAYNGSKFTMYRQPGRFAPDKLRVNLIYQDPTSYRSVTGSSQSLNWRYRSSAYDPDPSVLTGAIPGFAELANLYGEYCVHAMHAQVQLANQDTQSYIAVLWPGNADNNVNSLSLSDLAELSGNVHAVSKILGSVNGVNTNSMNTTAFGMQLVGSRFKTDLDYSASTSTNPVALYYINIGVYSPLANIGFPVVTKSRIIYDVEFFKLRQLES